MTIFFFLLPQKMGWQRGSHGYESLAKAQRTLRGHLVDDCRGSSTPHCARSSLVRGYPCVCPAGALTPWWLRIAKPYKISFKNARAGTETRPYTVPNCIVGFAVGAGLCARPRHAVLMWHRWFRCRGGSPCPPSHSDFATSWPTIFIIWKKIEENCWGIKLRLWRIKYAAVNGAPDYKMFVL